MESVGSLEEAARKRKERLQALKRKKVSDEEKHADDSEEPLTKIPVSDNPLESDQTETAKKEVAFKNYKPEDDTLQEKVQPPVKLAEVEDHIQDQLEAAKPEPVVEEIDLNNLAPRKPDWDLKRDVAKKLEKLERRTQRAIAELIRERLQSGEADLTTAVNASSDAAQENEDSD